MVEATVRADAFCHSMVRALVGCVLAVGDGRAGCTWPVEVLAEAARNGAVVVAEARGLTLEEVAYPADDELRARAELTRAKRVADVAESKQATAMRETAMDTTTTSVPTRRSPSPGRSVHASVWGLELELASGSGVFARGRLDIGTAALFRETEPPAAGRILDLGCGYGVIGLAVAVAVPTATVTAVDVNERAVLLANENAASLGVADRYVAEHPGAGSGGGDLRRDLVEPADPDRQAGAARAAVDLAAATGTRRTSRAGRRQEPRRRLPAALAGGAGLPDRARRQLEVVPDPGRSPRRRLSATGQRVPARPGVEVCRNQPRCRLCDMTYDAAANRYDTQATGMQYRFTGRSGLQLPVLSLGLWQNFGDDRSEENQRAILRRAFDRGITHFDLANNYGPPYGRAEENLGRYLRDDFAAHRDELVISTKAGWDMWPGPYGQGGGSRKYVLASLDQSLERMGLDYVDIFYSHRFDPDTPVEETMMALDQAVRQGKALYAGISSYSAAKTREAATIARQLGTPLLIHQPSYSLLNRWIEEDLLDELDAHGMGCIVFTALAQGLSDRPLPRRGARGLPGGSRRTRRSRATTSMSGCSATCVGSTRSRRPAGRSWPRWRCSGCCATPGSPRQ